MIVYEESREEGASRDGATVTRTFRVEPYAARLDLLDALLGGVRVVGDTLIRIPPARDPWIPWVFCNDAKATPAEVLNSPENIPAGLNILAARNYSNSARVVATYKTLDFKEQTQQNQSPNEKSEKELATESWDFGSTSLRQAGRYWFFDDGVSEKPLVGPDFSLTFAKIDYQLLRHFCVRKPTNAMTALANRVNYSEFTAGGTIWPPETMRYDGSHVSKKTTNKGQDYHEILHRFAIFPHYDLIDGLVPATNLGFVGWNRFWRPEKGWWQRPKLAVLNADPAALAKRTPFLYDEDAPSQTIKGTEVKGFSLLFHPAAK